MTLTDIRGVVHAGRDPDMPANMARYARQTDARTLADVIEGADIFMGLSAPRVFKPEWLPLLAPRPIILALANPDPEIMPEIVRAARPDAIVASGRSDFPNQVNNVLCFPFIFRGALDVGGDHHQRGDEAGRGGGHCRAGADGSQRSGGARLWRGRACVRAGLHHSKTL